MSRFAAVATVALALVAGCSSTGSSGTSGKPSDAQKLADLDGDQQPASVYQAALDALVPHCAQSESDVAAIVHTTLDDLRKNGVKDETELTVLQHLADAAPAGQRTDCQGVAAAYLVLREH